MAQACGIIEVFGLVTAFEAADAGCKAANVTLETFDRNKPANADALPVPLIICVKFRGSVEDVTAAVDAAQEVAERTTGMVSRYIISGPDEGTQMMFGLNAFDKN
ncbi:MAG: BMC domain-containing protein [Eubacterium sp.]|nr:BMC domain-containing protein [Eubacterium sp.]